MAVHSHALRLAAATAALSFTITLTAGVLPTYQAAAAPAFESRLDAPAHRSAPRIPQPQGGSVATAAEGHPRDATPEQTSQQVVESRARTVRTARAAVTVAPVESGDELAQAQSLLAGYIAQYPILAGSTVSFGDAKGQQAISYPVSGRIVISPTHTRSVSAIITHEIWHIIDYRDNGVLDWGENIPPSG